MLEKCFGPGFKVRVMEALSECVFKQINLGELGPLYFNLEAIKEIYHFSRNTGSLNKLRQGL